MNDDEKDLVDRVRKTVRKDNPRLPLSQIDGQEFWYLAEHAWPYVRTLNNAELAAMQPPMLT